MEYFMEFSKKKLAFFLCALCAHPSNLKIIKMLNNKSFKDFTMALKMLNQ